MNLIDRVEEKQMKENVGSFNVGDTVKVHVVIREGEKERIQVFRGDVISKKGSGPSATFTVRKMSFGVGVERIFPLHSPNVVDIRPIRSGKTKRSKLYYLRKRAGKGVKLSQRHSEHTVTK